MTESVQASYQHGQQAIPVPRQIAFEFPEDVQVHWKPSDPEFCAMVNGASLTMPYLEPFLIRTVREAMQLTDDAGVRDGARAFNMQEQYHFQTHRRFNELLKSQKYPELALLENEMQEHYQRLSKRSLRARMAYAAGFESMTLGVTRWLVENRVRLFAGADTRVASFVVWHFVEESEHKCVAYDVYQSAFGNSVGGYWARMLGVFHGSLSVMWFSMRGYKAILQKDGLWSKLSSRLRLARHLGSFVRNVGPYLLRAALPGHDPRSERDPQWVMDWIAGYASAPPGMIPLLDTAHPQMPVPFPSSNQRDSSGNLASA